MAKKAARKGGVTSHESWQYELFTCDLAKAAQKLLQNCRLGKLNKYLAGTRHLLRNARGNGA